MTTAIEVQISRDIASDDAVVGEIRELLPDATVEVYEFKAAIPPTILQLVADALTWITVLKLVAIPFLGKLASNAADDLWKHKNAIAAQLKRLAALLARVNRLYAPRARVHIGFPIPDSHWGTVLAVPSSDESECADLLALFAIHARAIEDEAQRLIASGVQPLGLITITVEADDSVTLSWQDQDGNQESVPVPLRRVG